MRIFRRKPKPYFEITSESNPKFNVRLERCDETHAQHVLVQLVADPSVPADLTLERR